MTTSPMTRLPELREELLVHEGPRREDGAPTWIIEDPARGRYFQLGWAQGEMLMRWHLGTPDAVSGAVTEETTLTVRSDDVTAFAKFLSASGLTGGEGVTARCMAERERKKAQQTVWKLFLHHYLFFRIPLVHPDRFLTRTLPWVEAVFFSRFFWELTVGVFIVALYLISRQWDVFTKSLMQFFTWEGAAAAGLTLAVTKVLHELGHAYAAKRLGCRIPTMGLAFMVMMPLLYTDTTDAWRLPRRRDRITVGIAGVAAEVALASWAGLLWNFLPEGLLKSAMLMLATTTWVMTLAVNLSPFMRFDGYYVLSDLLGVANLHQRSFAVARWRLRALFLGVKEAAPEVFSVMKMRLLVGYAYATWLYRLIVFSGIALMVYHAFFKALGIFLFCVEMGVFLVMPIVKELMVWGKAVKKGKASGRAWGLFAAVLAAVAVFFVPWNHEVRLPAVLMPTAVADLYAPTAAVVADIRVTPGDSVKKGDVLMKLRSDELQQELAELMADQKRLQWQQSYQRVRRESAASASVAESEVLALSRRLAKLSEDETKLTVTAPFDGVVADRPTDMKTGEVIAAGEWLATVVSGETTGVKVRGLVDEQHRGRLKVGAEAVFVPEDPSRPTVPLVLQSLDTAGVRQMADFPELMSTQGGAVAVRAAPAELARRLASAGEQVWVPEEAQYRVEFASVPGYVRSGWGQRLRGHVVVQCEGESLFAYYGRRAVAVLLRETGF